jgi:hypothetical protein
MTDSMHSNYHRLKSTPLIHSYKLWIPCLVFLVLQMVFSAGEMRASDVEGERAGKANSTDSNSDKQSGPPARDGVQSTVFYTTRVIKVPNQTKYPPYHGPSVHNVTPAPSSVKPISPLIGEVEDDSAVDTPNEGCSPSAEAILRNPFPLNAVKTRSIPAQVFRQWIMKTDGGLFAKQLRKDSVIVVKGKWDHAEHVLEACGIPFLLLDANKIPDKLANAQVLVVNCPGEFDDRALQAIQLFVKNGGYLLTTDWSLSNCIQPTFPHLVSWAGDYSSAELVDGEAVEPGNHLFRGAVGQGPWKLDDKCQIVKLINYSKVDVLVRSRGLSKEDGCNLGILALTFKYRRGRVLHLVGHFSNNTGLAFNSALPDPAPSIQISLRQAISLNFIVDGLQQNTAQIIHDVK